MEITVWCLVKASYFNSLIIGSHLLYQYKNFIRVTLVFTVYAMLLLNTISIVKSSFKLPLFFFSNVVYFLFYSKLCSLNDEVKWSCGAFSLLFKILLIIEFCFYLIDLHSSSFVRYSIQMQQIGKSMPLNQVCK